MTGGAASNIIGTDSDGVADEAERNVISGAWRNVSRMDDHLGGFGVVLGWGDGVVNNVVAGNHIGTDPTGMLAVPNSRGGIKAMFVGANLIGTDADGIRDEVERNVVSGNAGSGVVIDGGTDMVVSGNYVGTTLDGRSALPNGGDGIVLRQTKNATVGGLQPTAGNLASGNSRHGIEVWSGEGNTVQGNLAGTDFSGTSAIPNTKVGISVSSTRTLVGGTQPGARNITSGNGWSGISLYAGAGENVVQGNFVGTDITGLHAIPNHQGGVVVGNTARNLIGGATAEARNIIANNGADGIYAYSFGPGWTPEHAADNRFEGNYIGTDVTGMRAMPNSGWGVRLSRVNRNVIGGAASGAGNLIAASGRDGVLLGGVSADNVVQGNTIGIGSDGAAMPNGGNGVQIQSFATRTLIGGTGPGEGNTIGNNAGDGIYVSNGTSVTSWWRAEQSASDAMNRNHGTLVGGTTFALGQHGYGFQLDGVDDHLSIADSSTLESSIISLDAWIRPDAVDATQQIISKFGSTGNFAYQLGLAPGGVLQGEVSFDGTTVNSLATPTGVIAAGEWSHVAMVSYGAAGIWKLYVNGAVVASQATITANIYTGGMSPMTIGARTAGVEHFKGVIDEPAVHRTHLTDDRVRDLFLARGAGKGYATTVRGNSIFDNGGLGIDLAPNGVTSNDGGDLDRGTNDLQNFPVLSSVISSPSRTFVEGTLSSIAHAVYQLDFFASPTADPTGHGEGAIYLGSASAQTDAGGNAVFAATLPVSTPTGYFVAATATDVGGNTSEFGKHGTVVPFEPATIQGTKFHDFDGSGTREAGEPGLANWTIQLDVNADGTVDQVTTTDSNGAYAFTVLEPGVYRTREVQQSGWIQTTDDPDDLSVVNSGAIVSGIDFGNFATATISGHKFNDLNGNGIWDSATSTSASLTVPGTSDPWLAGMPDGSTASNGDVAPTHSPVEVTGLTLVAGDRLSFTATGQVANGPNLYSPTPDGGASTGHSGADENGISDIYSPVNALVGVFLGPGQPSLSPAPAALNFGTVASRDYLSLAPLLQQVFFIGDGLTSTGQVQEIAVPSGATRLFLGTMDGFGWYNNLGAYTVTVTSGGKEPALPGWIIQLDAGADGTIDATTTTASDGSYSFDGLAPRAYRVREVQQSGWTQTTADPEVVVTASGQTFVNADFGNHRSGSGATISGTKFHDLDRDGAKDAGEPGLQYWPIFIDANDSGFYDAGERRTWTDGNGSYSFRDLGPGSYIVREMQLTGWTQTTIDPHVVVIGAEGETVGGIDFGNRSSQPANDGDPAGGLPTDLVITKNAPRAVAGEKITYTLTVTNEGPEDSYGVILGDQLPTGLVFESATSSHGVCYGGQTVVCAVGALAVNETATVTIVAHVLSWVQDEIENKACVYSPADDLDPSTNCAVTATPIDRRADLNLMKAVEPQIAVAGGYLTYTLLVRNDGPSDATNVLLTDVLPPEVAIVSAAVSPQGSYVVDGTSGTTIFADLGTIASGETAQLTLVVQVADWLVDGTMVINHATVRGDHDYNPGNDGSTTFTPGGYATDLELSKTGPFTTEKAEVYYVLEVTNHGPSDSSGVIVGDDLPPDINFWYATASQGTVNQSDPLIWNIGPMVVGQTETLTVFVKVPQTVVIADVRNEAIVWGNEGDPNPENNHGGAGGRRDDSQVRVVKQAPPEVIAGERLTYTLQVTNEGPDASSNVIVGDTLPPGVTLVSVTPSQGSCYAYNPILCFLGPLDVNESAEVTIVAQVSPSLPEEMVLSNTAFAYGGGGPGWDHINTAVRRIADVDVLKTAPETVVAGTEMTYTLRATNRGPSDASDVILEDVLPENVIFKSATASKGNVSATTINGHTTVLGEIGTLAPGETATVEVIVLIPSSIPQATIIHNEVCVTAAGYDANLLNNCSSAGVSVIERSDLQLIKTAPPVVIAGEELQYVLEVYNRGPSDARGVILGDTLAAGVVFVSATVTQGTWTYSNGVVLGDIGYLAVGQREFLTITVFVPSTTLDGTIIGNTGCIVECGHDPNPDNDCSTAYTTITAKSVLTGVVYNDFNGNGWQDTGAASEEGIGGWQVYIDLNGNNLYDPNERSTYTDSSGTYTFAGLGKDTWHVRQVQDPGWLQTTDNPGGVAVSGGEQSYHGGDFGNKQGTLSGFVYVDSNNNGLYEFDDGERGIAGVPVNLTGTDDRGDAVNVTVQTAGDGSYRFIGLRPGSYEIVQHQPIGYLDGKETVGSFGGIAGNDKFFLNLPTGGDGSGYNCGELEPARLSGYVYDDTDDDGQIDNGEAAISGATVVLTGTNDLNEIIDQIVTSDTQGYYEFANLRPGIYAIQEQQPTGYLDGQDTIGSLGGTADNDRFSQLTLVSGAAGINYNFGEHGDIGLHRGQTATIGFWQNKNGQKLIQSLNGGLHATGLGYWLATNFPNMYGADAGANNLAGKTNQEISSFYLTLFEQKGQKLDAQVLATAFAVYVTDSDLAGDGATSYGFIVSTGGTGAATFSVGSSGASFGVEDETRLTVLQLLRATNARTVRGSLYNGLTLLRDLANTVYDGINRGGDI